MSKLIYRNLFMLAAAAALLFVIYERPVFSQCTAAPAGMVTWWPGEGNANDIQGPTYENGFVNSGASFAQGKVGQAFNFDGVDDFAAMPANANWAFGTGDFTVEFWMYSTTNDDRRPLVNNRNGPGGIPNMWAIEIYNVANRVEFHSGTTILMTATTLLTNSSWNHVAVTRTGTTLRMYINGVQAGTGTSSDDFSQINDLQIGRDLLPLPIGDLGKTFGGKIDELSIFSRSLSGAEISAIFNAGGAGICRTCAAPPENMIAWWPGNGNANDIVNGNNGTLVNGVTYAAGNVEQAFSLDGNDDYITIPHHVSQNPGAQITIEAWVKRASPRVGATILQKRSAANLGGFVFEPSGDDPDALQFVLMIGGTYYFATTPTGVLTTGVWQHVAATYDGAVMKIYVDGVEKASVARSGSIDAVADPMVIGKNVVNPGMLWHGEIDEVALLNRALTQTEIQNIVNAGSAGHCNACTAPPSNLVAWWSGEQNPNDIYGPTFENGSLVNGATFVPGKVGSAFSFDGANDYVEIADSPALDLTRISMSFWFRLNELNRVNELVNKFGPEGSNTISYGAEIGTNNKVCFRISTDGTLNGLTDLCSTTTFTTGVWYHFAGTYDGSNMKLYINGNIEATVAKTGNIFVSNESLRLGNYGYFPWFLNGSLDEVNLASAAYSAEEVLAMYNASGGGMCIPGSGCSTIPSGLTSWWRAEGTALDSRKAHHGTLVNHTTFAAGAAGKGFSFDGTDDYVSVPAFNMGSNWTVEGWVYPAACSDNLHCPIFSRSNANFDGMLVNYLGAGHPNNNEFAFAIGNVTGSAWQLLLLSGTKYSMNAWYHVAASKNGNTYALYVNGVKKAEQTLADVSGLYQTRDIMIGKWSYTTNTYLQGKIDEVAAFSRALTPSEIAAIYSTTITGLGKCAGSQTMADMDGDMWSDLSIFRPVGANGSEWWWLRSTGGNGAVQFGVATDTIMSSDFTGDGRTDVAFWRPSTGQWYILRSEDYSFYAFPFGSTGDIPVAADFDGDGKADPTVYRPSTTTWYINKSTGGTGIAVFGAAGDKPVPEDYDGDGKADIAVFRPNGTGGAEWWITLSSGGVFATQFGQPTDKAVPADYTGDGRADIAFWTPSNGYWYILRSDDYSYYAFPFGGSGDLPVPADYDGDAKADPGVYRPSNSNWYLNRSTAGILIQQFGQTGDLPVPNAFVR